METDSLSIYNVPTNWLFNQHSCWAKCVRETNSPTFVFYICM